MKTHIIGLGALAASVAFAAPAQAADFVSKCDMSGFAPEDAGEIPHIYVRASGELASLYFLYEDVAPANIHTYLDGEEGIDSESYDADSQTYVWSEGVYDVSSHELFMVEDGQILSDGSVPCTEITTPDLSQPAEPIGPTYSWVNFHPSIGSGEHRRTAGDFGQYSLTVGSDGLPVGCSTSGFDQTGAGSEVCAALMENARFTPATDALGNATVGSYSENIVLSFFQYYDE